MSELLSELASELVSELRIACFLTPHGFGHSARACAVLDAWNRLRRQTGGQAPAQPSLRPELFTTVPRWCFEDSLPFAFGYHADACDVGLVQRDALTEDPAATVERLAELLPFRPERVQRLAAQVTDLGCAAVLCDIAPLGLAVARHAGLPSVLIENFTWDWIYRAYLDIEPRLAPFADQLEEIFALADLHLQATPFCAPRDGAPRDGAPRDGTAQVGAVQVPPISRARRQSRDDVRTRLHVEADTPLILVTMGGIQWQYHDLDALRVPGVTLVLPGASDQPVTRPGLRLLPHRSGFFHPDLVASCDAVVGKLGYSTIAEVHQAGLPLGYVPRARFPESPVLERFALEHLRGVEIPQAAFLDGSWTRALPALLERGPVDPPAQSGADIAATHMEAALGG